MKKISLFENHAKSGENHNKLSKSVSYETLVGGTTTKGRAYEQTQSLSKGSASAPLTAVGTLTSQLCCSAKVVENFLHCHPERSEGSRKSNTKEWILHFASAPFKMTIMTLSLLLSLNLSTVWALTCTFTPDQNNSGKYSISVTGTGTGNTFDASSCDGQLPTDMSSWSDRTNKITSVTFDESVTEIGYYAFSGATSLTSVDMPNVTFLAEGAFEGATSLASVDMQKIEYITDGAFAGIPSLKYVGLPS